MQGLSNKDKRILERVDDVCATLRTTRAELLYTLLRGIVAECVQGASAPAVDLRVHENERVARAEAAIMRVLRQRRLETVRRLKQATSSKHIAMADWDKALTALIKAGELRVDVSAQHKRTVTLVNGG